MNGIENIVNNDGIGIAITGMSIVFTALVLITLYITVLPTLLKHLATILPEAQPHYHRAADEAVKDKDLMIAAVIASTLHRSKKRKEQAG